MKTKPKEGVLILECLSKSDPGSEDKFLSHLFSLMNVPHQYIEVHTRYQMLALLKKSPYKIIHITTHGSVNDEDKFLGFWTKDGKVSEELLIPLSEKLDGYTIISTACMSASEEFRNDFISITLCDYFIAPTGSPYFFDSVFFSHIFYHKYFINKKNIKLILKDYNKRYKNPHGFCLLSFDDFIEKILED